jgi:O-antigen ligase
MGASRVSSTARAQSDTGIGPEGSAASTRRHVFNSLDAPWLKIGYSAIAIAVFLSGYSLLRLGAINLTLSDVALLAAAIIFASRGRLEIHPFGSLTALWLLGLTLMLGALFISSAINGDPVRWINVAAQYTAALLLVPFVLASADIRFTQRLPLLFVIGVSISQLIGIIAFSLFTYADTRELLGDGFITGNGRVGAMAGEPNPNGAFIAFSLPMLIYSWRQGMISRRTALVCAILLVWGLLLSASFTGFVASAIAVSIALALTGFRYLLVVASIALVVVTLFIASDVALPEIFRERVAGALATGDLSQAGTFVARSELIAEAWELSKDRLLIGMGVDQYRLLSVHGAPVHNLHLLMWTEGGAVAFIGLLILLGLLFLLAFAGFRTHRAETAMAVAVVVVFLIYTISIPHMYSRFWTLPVMVALCTIYALRPSAPRLRGEQGGE